MFVVMRDLRVLSDLLCFEGGGMQKEGRRFAPIEFNRNT